MSHAITRILVANRSEIALRVIRTARDLGIETVAVYAPADRNAQYVKLADSAYLLDGESYADTYMNASQLVDVARRAEADGVHPGYGFLSEIPEFADQVVEAGLTWIGPHPNVLRQLGDKIAARRLAESIGVQTVPGISEPVAGRSAIRSFVERFGYPILTKKADGGGGRGIQVISSDADVDQFFAAHGADSEQYFVERFIRTARHIETQCERDSHGTFAVVSTRDCSVQRRNQKLIEEAPAPQLPTGAEHTIERWSRALFEAVGYVGLGTCEFLVEPDGAVYFLEVNPRLQVEHTVSEEVTGLDLVAEQIRIAAGGALTAVPVPRAHSFEFRITCEDPAYGMMPSTGTINRLCWPLGHGVRIESGVAEGDTVAAGFDPMLAKVIVTAPTRREALARSRRALAELQIEGVATPAALYADVIARPEFAEHAPSTRWFEDEVLSALESESSVAANSVAASTHVVEELTRFAVEVDGRRVELTLPRSLFAGFAGTGGRNRSQQPLRGGLRRRHEESTGELVDAHGMVNSQIQAIVVRVCVEVGDVVHRGDLLVVLESMKMESYVHAPYNGHVAEIAVEAGQNVAAYQPLVRVLDDARETTKE